MWSWLRHKPGGPVPAVNQILFETGAPGAHVRVGAQVVAEQQVISLPRTAQPADMHMHFAGLSPPCRALSRRARSPSPNRKDGPDWDSKRKDLCLLPRHGQRLNQHMPKGQRK
jgi:hypothetical protein